MSYMDGNIITPLLDENFSSQDYNNNIFQHFIKENIIQLTFCTHFNDHLSYFLCKYFYDLFYCNFVFHC